VIEKLTLSRYYFGIDSNELTQLLRKSINAKKFAINQTTQKIYMEKYEIEEDGDFKIPADLKYKFICEHIIGKNLDYDNLTCADIDNFVEGIEPIKFLGFYIR